MKTYICTGRTKKGNSVSWYYLQDTNSNSMPISIQAENLRKALINKEFVVLNLTLTKDYKIREKKCVVAQEYTNKLMERDKTINQASLEELEKKILKGNLLGKTKALTTACGNNCFVMEEPDRHIIYIPKNVEKPVYMERFDNLSVGIARIFHNRAADNGWKEGTLDYYLKKVRGNLQVIGGENVRDYSFLFSRCCAENLDLHLLNTSNAEKMENMFENCTFSLLDLKSFDTRKVKSMKGMFGDTTVGTLDISSFYLRDDIITHLMFAGAEFNKLIINRQRESLMKESLKELHRKCNTILWI